MEYKQQTENALRSIMIFCVLLGIVMINSKTNAAASYGFFLNPNHPGKCFINDSMILSPGDVIFYDTCSKLECQSEKGDVYIVSCGVYGVPPNCTIYYPHADEDYPACCKASFRCDHENELVSDHERNIKTKHIDNDESSTETVVPQDDTTLTANADTTTGNILK